MPWFWSSDAREMLARLAAIELNIGILRKAADQEKERDKMAQEDIDRLRRIVAENTSVTNSVVTLVQGLAQQIREAADDPAEIRQLADQLNADVRRVAEAVTANSPSQPQPEPQPEQPVEEGTGDASGEGGTGEGEEGDTSARRSRRIPRGEH